MISSVYWHSAGTVTPPLTQWQRRCYHTAAYPFKIFANLSLFFFFSKRKYFLINKLCSKCHKRHDSLEWLAFIKSWQQYDLRHKCSVYSNKCWCVFSSCTWRVTSIWRWISASQHCWRRMLCVSLLMGRGMRAPGFSFSLSGNSELMETM